MRTARYIILMVILCMTGWVGAQTGTYVTIQDFETWSTLRLRYKPIKKLSIGLSQDLRLKENSTTLDVYFTELELKYKLNSGFSVGAAGRFIRENDDVGNVQGMESHFRWNGDFMYSHKLDRFGFKYRLRYQSKQELNVFEAEPRNVFRVKARTNYNIRNWKLDPQASVEVFRDLGDAEWDKLRFTAGTSYDFKRFGELGLFLRTEKELTGSYPKRTNILGFNYTYTIKSYK